MRLTEILIIVFLSAFNGVAQESGRDGYFNKIKFGFLVRASESPKQRGFSDNGSGTEISMINGWFLNSQLALGIGAGVTTYVNPTVTSIPVYADVHYFFKRSSRTPFVYSNVGYGIMTDDRRSGKAVIDAGAGWNLKLGKKSSIIPEIGYRYQGYSQTIGGGPEKFNVSINSISLGVAVSF